MSNYRLDYNEPGNERDNPHDVSLEHLDEIIYGGKPSAATVAGFALDEITRLEREHADALAIERALADASVEAHAETLKKMQALEEENARLREALKPFADVWKAYQLNAAYSARVHDDGFMGDFEDYFNGIVWDSVADVYERAAKVLESK